jgi:5,10-methylene-tetrahydrofolate dehydrogenase/methenyl tetrahydrofolate cyclohydrolase
VLVSERPDSKIYFRLKSQACESIGINCISRQFPSSIKQELLENYIETLNKDANINGILVQLPLPAHINKDKIVQMIDPNKDVDGLHPNNIAQLITKMECPNFIPCAPKACIHILKEIGFEPKGKKCAIVGDSILVGSPMALYLQKEKATITVCNSSTKRIWEILKDSELVVVGIGKPSYIRGDWLKKGCIVLDAGINVIKTARGEKVVGDVDFLSASNVAEYITPVPGGIGPVTIAMLTSNVVESWKRMNFVV